MLERIMPLAWKNVPWLYCIGSALLFVTWLGEKQFEQEFVQEREELARLERRISSNRSISQLWYSHMHLLDAQEPKNLQAIAFASLWYMEFTLNGLQSSVAWSDENTAQRNKFAELRLSTLEAAKPAFRDGQYAKVISMASHVRAVELQSTGQLVSENDRYFKELQAREIFRDWLVRAFYVAGAGLIAFAFIRDRLRASSQPA